MSCPFGISVVVGAEEETVRLHAWFRGRRGEAPVPMASGCRFGSIPVVIERGRRQVHGHFIQKSYVNIKTKQVCVMN